MRALVFTVYCWLLVLVSVFAIQFVVSTAPSVYPAIFQAQGVQALTALLLGGLGFFWLCLAIPGTLKCLRLLFGQVDSVVGDWRHKAAETVDQAADVIKDAILDWGPFTESAHGRSAPEEGKEPLPSLDQEEFIDALRGRLEETLRRVAEAINDAPTGEAIAGDEKRVGNLVADFVCDALALGLQMRADAEAGRRVPGASSRSTETWMVSYHSESRVRPLATLGYRLVWAEKYRRMRAAGIAARLARTALRPQQVED
jgi:hypothetical protein